MSKKQITWLFVGAVVALVVGAVVALVTTVAALANGTISFGGPQVVTVDGPALQGVLGWLFIAAAVMLGGSIAAVASWIGALSNTFRLEDRTWFVALLALGVFSLGWLAMLAYLVAGPDSTAPGAARDEVATVTPG